MYIRQIPLAHVISYTYIATYIYIYIYIYKPVAIGVIKYVASYICIQVGTPDGDWGKDPNGKPEGAVSKALRHTVKCAANIAKDLIPSTGNEHVDAAIKTGLNVVEKQADADAKTSMKDRVKMGGKSVISGVADSVDIPDVSVAANVPQVRKLYAALQQLPSMLSICLCNSCHQHWEMDWVTLLSL